MTHVHHGKSSKDIIDADRLIDELALTDDIILLDAGCADGYFSIAASKHVGLVYALDSHEESIDVLKRQLELEEIKSVRPILADMTKKIPLEHNSVDICVMINVFHGLVANHELPGAMEELRKALKKHGRLAIVDFIKQDTDRGPPLNVKLSEDDAKELIEEQGFVQMKTGSVGEFSYLLVFEKV